MVSLAQRGFRHEALFYASRDEFLERTLDFLQAGIEADEPTLVVLNRDKIDAPFGEPLPEPHTEPSLVQVFQAPTLAALRQKVLRHALDARFATSASEDLALGGTEVATNSVVHGGGGGLMRLWEEDATLICEVSDTGRIDQPLAGRERPRDSQIGGFGLSKRDFGRRALIAMRELQERPSAASVAASGVSRR